MHNRPGYSLRADDGSFSLFNVASLCLARNLGSGKLAWENLSVKSRGID